MNEVPTDLTQLYDDLGIGWKRRPRLAAKYGDKLIPWLQAQWRWKQRQDAPRFPARQDGHYHPAQYVASAIGAIDDLESVPAEYQTVLVTEARMRFERHRQAAGSEEQARRDFKAVTATIKQTAVDMARAGADPMPFMAEVQQVVARYRSRIEDVA